MSLIDNKDTPSPQGLEAAVAEVVTRYLTENLTPPNINLYNFIISEGPLMSLIDNKDTPSPQGLEAAVAEVVTRYLTENLTPPNIELYNFIISEDEISCPNRFGFFSSHFSSIQPTIVTENLTEEPANEPLKGNNYNA